MTLAQRLTALVQAIGADMKNRDYSRQIKLSGNTVLGESHRNATIISTASITLTVPTGLPDGFQIAVIADVDNITFATSNTAFKLNAGKVVLGAGKTATLIKENGTDNFYLKGELS